MSEIVDVEVPTVGESITEVQLGAWIKSEGEWVDSGEDLVEIETEKADSWKESASRRGILPKSVS